MPAWGINALVCLRSERCMRAAVIPVSGHVGDGVVVAEELGGSTAQPRRICRRSFRSTEDAVIAHTCVSAPASTKSRATS